MRKGVEELQYLSVSIDGGTVLPLAEVSIAFLPELLHRSGQCHSRTHISLSLSGSGLSPNSLLG